jgi:hypothetical protein
VLVALNPAYFSLQTLAMIFASSQILPAGAGRDAGDADPQY